jgi:predicted ester cyclase
MPNTKTVERLVNDVMTKGKTELLDELMTSDFKDPSMPPGFPQDRNGWKMLVQHVRTAFPDVLPKIQQSWEVGDDVIVRVQATGTMKKDGLGFKAHGKKVTWNELHVWSFKGTKIAHHYGIGDVLVALMMSGAQPAMPPMAKT